MRRTISVLVLTIAFGWSRPAGVIAQGPEPDSNVPSPAVAEPAQDQKAPDQKPPAAVGEEATKPRRSFLPALGHNLVDDVKHIPRRNSLYWLAGGTALALAIHPEDGKINRRFLGNKTVDRLFTPGKYIGNTGVFAAGSIGTYIFGKAMDMPRIQHLGMDETEAMILSEGISEAAKLAFRRDRPIDPGGHQAKGYSLPSGHATLTFAAEIGRASCRERV